MTPVADKLLAQDWHEISMQLYSKTCEDVEQALTRDKPTLEDFIALVSPAAEAYLPQMSALAERLTRQRFGYTMGLFVPLYLSNLCANECTYCGFSMSNRIRRKTLSLAEVKQEAQAIKAMGFNQLLLVTGEHETKVGMAYFCEVVAYLKTQFDYLMMEVQPLNTDNYATLRQLGLNAVLVYQETYQRRAYARYHLRGHKQDFDWRLQTSDRLGQAGVDKIGIASLLGLNDWRTDSVMTALHARLLQQHYWRSRFVIGFPRLRPCEGSDNNVNAGRFISSRQLVQLICAHRILHPYVELSLSTRESQAFRDHAAGFGITSMSAGSSTQPGGYSKPTEALAQFETNDNRAPAQVAQALSAKGIAPVWSDWLTGFRR